MSKNIMEQATNKVNIIGKLLDCTFREGTTKTGQPYQSANMTIRVNQTYDGHTEISEIPVSLFATQFTSTNKPHPGWKNINDLKNMKTVQNYGEMEAATVRLGSGSISENNFVSRSTNQVISSWRVNTSFINEGGKAGEIASFNIDIFIMDMHDEVDREGEPTGRLIIKGGIVQYGGRLDVLEFFVEESDKVNYVSRNWNVGDCVNVGGRIRYTSKEEKRSASTSSWGEELPETSTRIVRELIITRGSDEPFDEDFAYSDVDIKRAFNERKALLEQMVVDAQKAPAKSATTSKYSWE